jgi:hypothetical protein
MMKQKYGRIIMTSSASGLYGSGGQANYASAKLALVGFSNSLAKEGAKYNIVVNALAPVAGSRMTETVMPKDMTDALDPKFVAPIVAFLCHESCTQTGGTYETGAGYVGAVRWQRSAGVHFPLTDGQFTPETIATKWAGINDFGKDNTNPTSLGDTMAVIMGQLGQPASANTLGVQKPKQQQPQQLKAAGANGTTPAAAEKPDFASDAIFHNLDALCKSEASIAQKLNARFVYNISKGGAKKDKVKTWVANLSKEGPVGVSEGPLPAGVKPAVTIDIADQDYCDLAAGKASAQMLYMKGRKVTCVRDWNCGLL